MLKTLIVILGLLASVNTGAAQPRVEIEISTNMGRITLELYPDKAPQTVENFLQYVKAGFYDGTIFHRVIPDFMIQGGGFTPAFNQKKTRGPVKNEAGNGLKNVLGTVAMARTSDPNSATAQFFINVADNPDLDFRSPTQDGFGYCVFGKVVKGMDVVNKISRVATGPGRPPFQDVPLKPIVIEHAKIIQSSDKSTK